MDLVHSSGNGLRRVPVQQRSAERFARILDAAAAILDEGGYEELTTREVAARAGVPIGSVYRFFSNKRAMADALARRNLDTYLAAVTDRLDALDALGADRGAAGGWRRLIDVVVDQYVAMRRTVPGFALVSFAGPAPGPAVNDLANHIVADRLRALLIAPLGSAGVSVTDDRRLRTAFVVGVEAADALLKMAFRADPQGEAALIAETKVLLRAYLAGVLEP
ncbi:MULTISPECIES: TetR/AcrR family transcriptional regulator [unclassified Streptomyces]|uniref:TetR/AcrR family transcriptional regulator n=2 Tax=unclassified Streptomyces TaxID=2593676 RepID=UPI000476058F|nr:MULTISPECIES: TetR/AcrR family transcriptional regulator [unclassified Streptomyces]MYX36604.1 TetR family transcriptional regulator [Streptomyces sp. SID8377]